MQNHHIDPNGVFSLHLDIHNEQTPNAMCSVWIVRLRNFLEKPGPPGHSLWSPREVAGSHHGDFQDSGMETRKSRLGRSHSVSLEKEETGWKQTLSTLGGE